MRTIIGMRIYLQAKPGPGEAPKYCQFLLHQDLLGGWSLIRETGLQGGRPQVKREQFLTLDAAQEALMLARDLQLRKGFRVMISEGAEPPSRYHVGE